ncbi:MAG: RNA polymerase sigma factor [Lachnospiraceae bacterium]|nr:RNA polymerase sigma factor [Lachnospiraceae bacterium]
MTKEQLYTEYHDKVYAYVIHRVRSTEDAEDVVSEVFIKVLGKLDSFDESKAKLSTWIYQIAKHTVIDYYRKYRISEELPEELMKDDEIDEGLLNEETLVELANALKRLDEEQREIIVRRYYNCQTLQDIAASMSLSYGVVKLRHKEALGRLERYMNRPAGFTVIK